MLEYGEFSEGEVALFAELLDKHDAVIDAGANMGALTLPLAHLSRWVFAFEPQPYMFQCLAANMAINSVMNASVFQAVLSDKPGVMAIPLLDPRQNNSFGSLDVRTDAPVKLPVRVMTIDGLNLASCGMIKVDVEGMEMDVLRGAVKTIEDCRPIIYAENALPDEGNPLVAWLRERDYECWRHYPFMFNEENFAGLAVDIWNDEALSSINTLAWPKEKSKPIKFEDWPRMELFPEAESACPPCAKENGELHAPAPDSV